LNGLRDQFGNDESFVLVLGADAIRKMDFWFRPRAVPSLCNVCILNRAGERVDIPSVLAEMNEIADGGLLDNLPSGYLMKLHTPDLFVSSTLVRSLIAKGATQLPVPPNVAEYLFKYNLYQDTE
jgi:nicotinic acid mononucleotide adenylyltransferase